MVRLERQKVEWYNKWKEEHRINHQLSSSLKKQTVDPSVIDNFKETIATQKDTISKLQKSLSDLEKENEKLNSDIESLREFNKYLQRDEKDPAVLELEKDLEKDGQSRLEYFNNGYWEDKWGLSFFDDLLLLNINPFNGYRIFVDTQSKLTQFLKLNYNDIWETKLKQLDKYRHQHDRYLMDELTLKKKRNQLGMEIWKVISEDWRIYTILSERKEKKMSESPF